MSRTKGSPNSDDHASASGGDVSDAPFTLRDLYVRASISGNSLATELGLYLNIDQSTFSPTSKGNAHSSHDEPSVHEQALAAILEVVISNASAPIEYVRSPEPPGGVQEWWARMLSGSMRDPQSPAGTNNVP